MDYSQDKPLPVKRLGRALGLILTVPLAGAAGIAYLVNELIEEESNRRELEDAFKRRSGYYLENVRFLKNIVPSLSLKEETKFIEFGCLSDGTIEVMEVGSVEPAISQSYAYSLGSYFNGYSRIGTLYLYNNPNKALQRGTLTYPLAELGRLIPDNSQFRFDREWTRDYSASDFRKVNIQRLEKAGVTCENINDSITYVALALVGGRLDTFTGSDSLSIEKNFLDRAAIEKDYYPFGAILLNRTPPYALQQVSEEGRPQGSLDLPLEELIESASWESHVKRTLKVSY
jgi:hypothetical protein